MIGLSLLLGETLGSLSLEDPIGVESSSFERAEGSGEDGVKKESVRRSRGFEDDLDESRSDL